MVIKVVSTLMKNLLVSATVAGAGQRTPHVHMAINYMDNTY